MNASLEGPYVVQEEIGFVEVCVVLDGTINRMVVLELATLNLSATG